MSPEERKSDQTGKATTFFLIISFWLVFVGKFFYPYEFGIQLQLVRDYISYTKEFLEVVI